MKIRISIRRCLARSVPLSALSLFLSACSILPEPQADTVRHFTLSEPAQMGRATEGVVVRPVRLAGHLRNRTMAVRVSAHEVVYLEDVRWAEPLDEALTQVLRNRLRAVTTGATVVVQVQRCELVRSDDNTVQLVATYAITPAGGGEAQSAVFTATPRKWEGGDPGAIIGLMREAAGELADAIAAVVEK
ncbi:hypothetical protein ESB00_17915 [Oleiharenicola lentus]|jgi:uncharacterized lipoprotein YmbA|uniref:ABC-type transport auxiliary lipoprotein component domain-containing protein n=1 Tax=Oleiharenicola lentus TaxID=2508720 RepID=A0A4Q1C548_9BACT|nr:ABC-type transport auxiliary lipoprotein family protein [Oleiharenicola lentus]RXK53568.1 hypothetical protein ESB00_17915 [Oleiharenicola lentus]